MLKNYVRLALRNILRHKGTSMINIFGFSVGIASAILVILYVANELSYDKFYPHADRVYRLAVEALIGDTEIHQTHSSALTYTRLREDFPEVEEGVKLIQMDKVPVTYDNQVLFENRIFIGDSTFFIVFPRSLLLANEYLLSRPNTIVLDESTAIRYFGSVSGAAGKVVAIDIGFGIGQLEFEVTGVYEDFPENSHFHPEMLISSTTFPQLIYNEGSSANNFTTYLLLKEGTNAKELEKKLVEFTRNNMGAESYDEWVEQGNYWTYYLQPLTFIHLHSDLNGEFEANGNAAYVLLFSAVAVFLLLIASINFMNLSTARSSLRAREVAMRKAYGASRNKLTKQFMGETIVVTFISLLIGILLALLFLPLFNNVVGRELGFFLFNIWKVAGLIFAGGILLGVFSGLYPSFILSAFSIVEGMKGQVGSVSSGLAVRRILVIVQFSIAILLIISTLTVIRQLDYLQDKNLGFDKEHLLVLDNPGQKREGIDAFKEEMIKEPEIQSVTVTNLIPGKRFSNIGFGAEGIDEGFTLNIGRVDPDYLAAFGIQIKEGRFFSDEFPADSCAVVINEKAVELLGWQNNPLAKRINNWSSNIQGIFHVIGVIEDFHYESLHSAVRPMALFLNGGYYEHRDQYIVLKITTQDLSVILTKVEDLWTQMTGSPFEYFFMDSEYDRLYTNEMQTRKIFIFFASITILIACLGLMGLASFVSTQRTREIGIRKVFGAKAEGIVLLLNKQFTLWVILANLIAWPAGWYVMKKWLENFAFRIPLSIWIFISAAILAILIASVIVSFQTITAAKQNPVDAIRYE
ncbi:ABC transporter permease [Bacteroidota bacterium]